ncbi:response regulator [Desulfobacter latus]|uniref:Sensory/regulatory protein RpfC n=1 Tax=Desulfobacter latus TaxID=2292 RepID=A0A850T0P8_9BACT|nr:response regulator [Desulfobacter latus]NWH05273.1 response regulator [Desulfobacter latus]
MGSALSYRNLKISHYLIIVFLILSMLINIIITVTLYQAASKRVKQDIQQRLHDIVAISARSIDADLHEQLLTISRQQTPLSAQNSKIYKELKQTLQKIRDAASDIHFIYTMRTTQTPGDQDYGTPQTAPQIMFVVDAEADPGQMARLGDIYTDAGPRLTKHFLDMRTPVIEASAYQDQWGSWLSGYAPFYDSQGRRAGVVGVDISAATIAQYQERLLFKSLMIFLATLPLILGGAMLIGRLFGAPLTLMQKGAQAITSGDLGYRLKIPAGREPAILADAMNRMAAHLQQEQDNLKLMVEKYKNIFENASEGIFQTTPEGRLLTANTAMVKMLGYESIDQMTAAIDGSIGNIYQNPEDRRQIVRRLKQEERISGLQVELKQKDGSGIMVELNIHLCDYGQSNGEGKIIEGSIRDITQRIEQEKAEREKEAALASSQAKSEFLANMSHEIRTPLNAVMGLTDLLARTELSDSQQQYLQKITISSKSLLAVINDILDFSKIEAGRLELEQAPFSLYDLMANVSEIFAFNADEKGLEFLLSIDENVSVAVIGDSVRLGQVLINLVGNAIKFTREGEVVVRVDLEKATQKDQDKGESVQWLRFSVRDSGIGIPADRLETLFESFTQADGSTTRKYGGTGLGLTISRQLVRLMGGKITVTSTPGEGSCFSFVLPLKCQPPKDQIRLNPPKDLRGLKVLIVDDNRTSLELLAGIIQSFHMEAVTAQSGAQALDLLRKQAKTAPFDLVLMDWKMPEMNGLETSRKIKLDMELDKTPIVCMVSAHAREDLIHQADRKFLDAFLHKPVNQSFLFDTIMELFGRHEAQIAKPGTRMPALKSLENEQLKGKHILLVEDNEINREVALEWLNSAGLEVDMAVNGKEALASLGIEPHNRNRLRPDAVLMDIQMPEMDGFEATVYIRKDPRYTDLPVIAMTAHALKGDREKCLDVGMDDYVTKPIDPENLFQTLARWSIDSNEPASRKSKTLVPQKREPEKPEGEPGDKAPPFEIPGIIVAHGLYRANNNEKLYEKLLRSFIRDFGHARDELTLFLTQKKDLPKAIDNARITAHSIKGVSGNIGAEALCNRASDLEQAIDALKQSKGEINVPDQVWQPFCHELDQVLSGIKKHIDKKDDGKPFEVQQDQNSSPGPAQDMGALVKILARLGPMLDDDLDAARDMVDRIARDFKTVLGEARCRNLMDAMDDFAIDEASDMIEEMFRIVKEKTAQERP